MVGLPRHDATAGTPPADSVPPPDQPEARPCRPLHRRSPPRSPRRSPPAARSSPWSRRSWRTDCPAATTGVIADEIEGRVRAAGAVPATIAVLDGVVRVGLGPAELDRLCESTDIAKLSVRDVGVARRPGQQRRDHGGVDVGAGPPGRHRGVRHRRARRRAPRRRRTASTSPPISGVLASTPVLVVCAGVKSILDVPGTLEYLETLSVPVIGYRTDAFPGLLPVRLRRAGDLAGGHPGAGRRDRAGPARAGHRPGRGGAGQPVAGRIGSSIRSCTTRRWPPGWRCWRRRG